MGAIDDLLKESEGGIAPAVLTRERGTPKSNVDLLFEEEEPKGYVDRLLEGVTTGVSAAKEYLTPDKLTAEEISLFEKGTGQKLHPSPYGLKGEYSAVDPEELGKISEEFVKAPISALFKGAAKLELMPEALRGTPLRMPVSDIRRTLRQIKPEETAAKGLIEELKTLPKDILTGAVEFPFQAITHPIETAKGIAHGFAVLADPIEAAKRGELLGAIVGDVGLLWGLRKGYLAKRYPEVADRVRRAGFKDVDEAVDTLDKNPADTRFRDLPERDEKHLHKVLNSLYKAKLTPPPMPGMIEPPLPRLMLPAPEVTYGEGFTMKAPREAPPLPEIPKAERALYGAPRAGLGERYPGSTEMVVKAGFKDLNEAVATLTKNPADKRFNRLDSEGIATLQNVLDDLYKEKAAAAKPPAIEPEAPPVLEPEAPPPPIPLEQRISPPVPVAPPKPRVPIDFKFGKESRAIIPGEFNLKTKLAIVDLDKLPERRAETQIRDRVERGALKAQEEKMFQDFEPALLEDTPVAGQGAIITNKNGEPLTGQARTNVLQRNHREKKEGTAKGIANEKSYREETLYKSGILSPEEIDKMNKPALVRVLQEDLTPEQEVRFSRLADASEKASLSPVEMSLSRASLITPAITDTLNIGEKGLTLAGNKDAISSFLGKLPVEEANALVDKNRNPTPDALKQFGQAILGAVIKDKEALGLIMENPDPNIKRPTNAIMRVAPDILRVEQRSPNYSMAEPLSEALRELARLRELGEEVDSHILQKKMFADPEKDLMVKSLLNILSKASESDIAARLKQYTEVALTEEQPSLMGAAPRPRAELMVKMFMPELWAQRGAIRFPWSPEERMERYRRIKREIEQEESAGEIPVAKERRAILEKNAKAMEEQNTEYQKDIAQDPELLVRDAEGKPITDLKEHPLVKIDPIEKATMSKDIMGVTLATGDSLTILGRAIPMELVRVDRKIIPRTTRIVNYATGMDEARMLAKKLKKTDIEDIALALEDLKRDESGNIVKSKTVKAEMLKDPIKGKIVEAFDNGYAWARTKEGFDAPMIRGQEGYMHHILEEMKIKEQTIQDIKTGRAVADDTTIKGVELLENWRLMRKGAPGWKLDPFEAWDTYVKKGMRRKYMKPAIDRTDAMAKEMFSDKPNRMKYYNKVKDSAMGIPYFIDKQMRNISVGKINLLRISDVASLGQYISTIGGSLSAIVSDFSTIGYTAAQHPWYSAKAMASMTREIHRMTLGSWIKGTGFLDTKASPALRNPMIYQAVENFYNVSDWSLKGLPGHVKKALFGLLAFSEYAKRGLNFHVGLMMELDKGTPLKTAYGRAAQFALERGLPLGKLLRNEYVRNMVPRNLLMFRQPSAASLNMLYRMSKEDPKGLLKIAAGLGAVLYFQSEANKESAIDNIGLFPHRTREAKWDVFRRLSPITQAMDYLAPSITESEIVEVFEGIHKARTTKQRKMALIKAGLWGTQMVGVPISPKMIQGGKFEWGKFVDMPATDVYRFHKLAMQEYNGKPTHDIGQLLEELFRIKTRPRYWFR